MSNYKHSEPPKDKEVIWLEVIKNPHWYDELENLKRIPADLQVGSITWVFENDNYRKTYLIEQNRHGVNFDKSCFKIIDNPYKQKEMKPQIEIPEGKEIDLENSKIVFKDVQKEYPLRFIDVSSFFEKRETYLMKSAILCDLIVLRDAYNEIDGNKEFQYGENNHCIEFYNKELGLDYHASIHKVMHFRKQETAQLFLKRYQTELESVKEFL